MADTRKDKRAPISLKVRFKSATLDEFIEQYSVDISRGGIFIKSKTPMSVGTLLKFEFQLKDESRLIHGVGRVVWKREPADGDDPPGMGIKFIKMDPESRALVEQMVQKRGDKPGRFEEGQDGGKPDPTAGGFFPSTTPESELPAPEDRTQVRHASEFLASALAEGDADSAKQEAEAKAEEARKRTEEIEKKRAEAKKKRKPRIKKTLVGMGIPAAGENEGEEIEPPSSEADEPAEEEAKPAREVSESAETLAMDREAIEKQEAAAEEAEEAPAKAAEPEPEEPEAAEADDADEKAAEEAAAAAAAEKEAAEKAAEAKAKDEAAAKAAQKKAEKAKAEKAEPKPKPKPAVSEARPQTAAAEEEPKSRMGMIFFALVAAVVVGVIVYMQMQPGDDPVTEPTDVVDPGEEEGLAAEGEGEEPIEEAIEEPVEEPTPTVSVNVTTEPEGATVFVRGEEAGAAPLDVDLPIGEAVTVAARLTGYTEATQEVTAAEEGTEDISLTLEAMDYVISVTTSPGNARVRATGGGSGQVTGTGEIELRGAPDEAVELTASLRGHDNATATVEPGAFTAQDGRMVASVTLTLTERERPRPTGSGGGGGGSAGGGSAGGGAAGGGSAGGGGAGGGAAGGGGAGGGAAGGGSAGGGSAGGGGAGGGAAGGGSAGGGSAGGGSAGGGSAGGGGGGGGAGGGGAGGGEAPEEEAPPDNPF